MRCCEIQVNNRVVVLIRAFYGAFGTPLFRAAERTDVSARSRRESGFGFH